LPTNLPASTLQGVSTIEANPNDTLYINNAGSLGLGLIISTLGGISIESQDETTVTSVLNAASVYPSGGANTGNLGASGLEWNSMYATDGFFSTISGVSSINGAVYPPPAGIPASIASGSASITTDGATSSISMTASGILPAITVGVDPGTLAQTLQIGGAAILTALSEISTLSFQNTTAGLISNAVELSFTTGGGIGGMITNLSTINGASYPPPVTVPADITVSTITVATSISATSDNTVSVGGPGLGLSSVYSGLGNFSTLEGVSSINGFVYPSAPVLTTGITTNLTLETWTANGNGIYYLDYVTSYSMATLTNVQATTINSDPDTASGCWIVTITPNAAANGTLRIYCAADPGAYPGTDFYISWLVTNP
jgi:hypothetical protein